jgi:hypothetical protein
MVDMRALDGHGTFKYIDSAEEETIGYLRTQNGLDKQIGQGYELPEDGSL